MAKSRPNQYPVFLSAGGPDAIWAAEPYEAANDASDLWEKPPIAARPRKISGPPAVWQPRYYGFNIWSRSKVEEKLEYMHMNPVRAGFVERVTDWQWSSARWYVENRTVGLPIRWPPGLEADDDFAVN